MSKLRTATAFGRTSHARGNITTETLLKVLHRHSVHCSSFKLQPCYCFRRAPGMYHGSVILERIHDLFCNEHSFEGCLCILIDYHAVSPSSTEPFHAIAYTEQPT